MSFIILNISLNLYPTFLKGWAHPVGVIDVVVVVDIPATEHTEGAFGIVRIRGKLRY